MKTLTLLFATLLLALVSSSCKSTPPKATTLTSLDEAKNSFQPINDLADSIFWHATDTCMRENSDSGQISKLENFLAEHECEVMEIKEISDDKNHYFTAITKIHNPKYPNAWYQISYEEAGKGWQSTDCKLISDGHEMNYFEGRFLSATNLKPYIDAATASLVK